ncbi:unnamed protein product, partial [Mesorhabditis spiculigera]
MANKQQKKKGAAPEEVATSLSAYTIIKRSLYGVVLAIFFANCIKYIYDQEIFFEKIVPDFEQQMINNRQMRINENPLTLMGQKWLSLPPDSERVGSRMDAATWKIDHLHFDPYSYELEHYETMLRTGVLERDGTNANRRLLLLGHGVGVFPPFFYQKYPKLIKHNYKKHFKFCIWKQLPLLSNWLLTCAQREFDDKALDSNESDTPPPSN